MCPSLQLLSTLHSASLLPREMPSEDVTSPPPPYLLNELTHLRKKNDWNENAFTIRKWYGVGGGVSWGQGTLPYETSLHSAFAVLLSFSPLGPDTPGVPFSLPLFCVASPPVNCKLLEGRGLWVSLLIVSLRLTYRPLINVNWVIGLEMRQHPFSNSGLIYLEHLRG